MDPQSPPKRMTRARAAAKGTEPATKPTRVVTAAARARAMRGTASTSAKRKARSDDVDDSDHEEPEPAVVEAPTAVAKPKATRGRPKKTQDAVPQPEPETQPAAVPAKPRGRPKKVAVEPVVEEPAKTTRATRAKKVAVEADESVEPPKKTTRGRPASAVTTRTATAKPAAKKSVTFEEPEKENMAPVEAGKGRGPTKPAATTTGLKAKPVRRPAAAATRATRGVKTAATGEKPTPLSPKKVNQLTSTHADSDDELAPTEQFATKPLRKNPIRPPIAAKKAAHDVQTSSVAEDNVADPSETLPRVVLGSPAKRLPQSPFKNCIKSPPKRVEGVLPPSITQTAEAGELSQSPFKTTLLQSPAKRPPGMPKGFEFGGMAPGQPGASPFKTSLLLSPAKRAYSPIKPPVLPAVEDEQAARSPAPKPTLLATPLPTETNSAEDEDSMVLDEADEDAGIPNSPTRLRFPGRMSAVLPRHADPALTSDLVGVAEAAEEDTPATEEPVPAEAQDHQVEDGGDPMTMDTDNEQGEDIDDDTTEPDDSHTTPPVSPSKSAGPMFKLRNEDLHDYDSETDCGSEDELAPRRKLFPTAGTSTPLQAGFFKTPASRSAMDATPAGRSTAKRVRMDDGKFGFTPLADQLSGWTAGPSPLKLGNHVESPSIAISTTVATPSIPVGLTPAPGGFFDEAMAGQSDAMVIDTKVEVAAVPDAESPVLEDVAFTEEDVALAAEANEMSLMEHEKIEDHVVNHSFDDSISEASQEYGDENEIPIDPRLEGEPSVPLTTPRRALNREFHTVSKVPLKPADDSSPVIKIKKRGHSISRLPAPRPTHSLTRNATVISYSPTKNKNENIFEDERRDERAGSAPPVTPTKSEAGWSLVGTPARTPQRDVDPALLRGAIVFVDVHTSEGADASGIFIELLTQMGARCIKTWSWNPSSDSVQDGSSSKIGITHVVYKDGGKRTLEKVRESGGVVQCVGVSWVLDCERENQWLDEAPYYIDTKVVPRGGARRRKSMEPRAIANLNGMLVPTPVRNSIGSRGSQTAPSTPANGRRASALWIRTPEEAHDQDSDEDDEDDDSEWRAALAPVPKTPAPEAVARYVANLTPATPSDSTMYTDDMDDDENDDAQRAAMLTRTCPPKPTGPVIAGLGHGILGQDKDERVLMRLMAARRKSLQFAPKIGSPLARTWN